MAGNMHPPDWKVEFPPWIKKYKTFSVLIYSYIGTSGNWKNEKLCGNTMPAGRSVLTQFRVFPIFTSVDITVSQYRKNVLYFFLCWHRVMSTRLLANQRSIFRINKCYIIISNGNSSYIFPGSISCIMGNGQDKWWRKFGILNANKAKWIIIIIHFIFYHLCRTETLFQVNFT